MKDSTFEKLSLFIQVCFILAIIVFVFVAADTATKITSLKEQIKEEKCVPYGMNGVNKSFEEDLGLNISQGLEINRSTSSPSSRSR